MVDQADMTGAGAPATFRDEDGGVRAEFVEQISDAIGRGDAKTLRELAGDLHEADTGDLIEALEAELRPRFVELMGRDFDFTALTEVEDAVRGDILDELPVQIVADGVRELDSDDAAYILEDLPAQEQAEILQQLPPPERGAVERIVH
jgi:magnesium transporter